jgi:tetratricopeptide (TPR) repeat protein
VIYPFDIFLSRRSCLFFIIAVLAVSEACATGGKKVAGNADVQPSNEEGSAQDEPGAPSVSADRRMVIQSLARNPWMQRPVNRQKMEQLTQRMAPFASEEKADKASRKLLEAYLSAQRLAGRPLPEQAKTVRAIADQSMKKNPDFDLPHAQALELAISACEAGRLSLAEFFLDPLLKLKDGRVRAAAFNLAGVIALREERVPEAVVSFKEALKTVNDYRPAQINLGMLALHGGDFALARSLLANAGDDALVSSGLATLARFKDSPDAAAEVCGRAVSRFPDYKPIMFNCALNEIQGRRDWPKAKDYLGRMLRAPGGNDSRSQRFSDRAQRLLTAIETEAAASQAKPSSDAGGAGTAPAKGE